MTPMAKSQKHQQRKVHRLQVPAGVGPVKEVAATQTREKNTMCTSKQDAEWVSEEGEVDGN
jgi:hypothetical protein